ncbi:hypothetical protein KBT16_20665 [Nostoc sp. CCCryo 231-06]|nr:hypothetical protein [Nostoc sp. CCCryo 231-06]
MVKNFTDFTGKPPIIIAHRGANTARRKSKCLTVAIALQPFGNPTAGVGKAIAFVFDKSKFANFLY